MMLEEFIKQLEMQCYENLKDADTDESTFLPALINITNENYQLLNWLKELQAHREAWMKVVSAIDQHTEIHSDGEFYIKNFDVKKIIAEYRPKEGDADETTK